MAIVNGIGYDTWATRLIDANPAAGRVVVDVGSVVALGAGANPHQWYAPSSVAKVAARISAGYERLDPHDRAYFERRRTLFESAGLGRYRGLISSIRARFHGVEVGYSESVFAPLGKATGLDLATPAPFAKAIAEGTEVSARDVQTVESQLERNRVSVWIYNSQNATPEVRHMNELARAHHIPVVTITETLDPPGASFQQWQDAQLEALLAALRRATGR
jgi:zinc/manganese transport system substrate-binding protein